MKLSIITINWNNVEGLKKTVESVMKQSCQEFEYVIVDGGSTDGSVDVVKQYSSMPNLRWVSERDKGIYNAMNKGILMSTGEYLHFLNSGDTLVDNEVVKKMFAEIERNGHPNIMIGNLLKNYKGTIRRDSNKTEETTLWRFYNNSINHPASYIKRELFERYGLYDESLKIVSDWKWFMQVIVFEKVKPVFVNVDTVLFDMQGISQTNEQLLYNERRKVLDEMVHPEILADYRRYGKDIRLMQRIRRHKWAYTIVYYLERLLFKIEKRKNK